VTLMRWGDTAARRSENFHAVRDLSDSEERFDEFSLAANGHFREAPEPFARRNFRLVFEPGGEELKLHD
jgi:hypothetical protein